MAKWNVESPGNVVVWEIIQSRLTEGSSPMRATDCTLSALRSKSKTDLRTVREREHVYDNEISIEKE